MHHPVLCGLSTERTCDSKNPRLHPSDANPLDFAHNDIVITPIMEARCLGVVAARRTSHNPTPCPRAGVALAVADRRRSADFVPLKLEYTAFIRHPPDRSREVPITDGSPPLDSLPAVLERPEGR